MSTAKSMATLYLNGKRNGTPSSNTKQTAPSAINQQQRFKSSTSNLAQSSQLLRPNSGTKTRLKSTSMTNLVAGNQQQQLATGSSNEQHQQQGNLQRPMSRNALDSIHNGMNAKYAQVQSKVYLQNIKPSPSSSAAAAAAAQQQHSKIPGSTRTLAQQQQQQPLQPEVAPTTVASVAKTAAATRLKGPRTSAALASERSLLVAKLKVLEDELASLASERENLRQELEREKGERGEQVQKLKLELQEKLAEHDRQNEEYHKKLLEAYELADQNRRAADSVLSESRQRDEESRKKIELLESELNELKEFVSVKEEMMGKMYELREQLRQERERYEEQLKSLHQVFESEKISHEEELMLKVKHSMLLKQHSASNSIKLDENSNSLYFNRIKPALEESNESINKQHLLYNSNSNNKTLLPPTTTGCRQCQSGSSQLHKSEQDIYGSKMSTRMQDTANRAWKASRKFASSVITGGVNLSACRQCTKRTGGVSVSPPGVKRQVAGEFCSPLTPNQLNGTNQPEAINTNGQLQQQHTSIIKVGMNELESVSPAPQRLRPASARQQQPPLAIGPEVDHLSEQQENSEQQQLASLIRVDENNKLTIVTKFSNDSECQLSNGPEAMGASSRVSERSRCESSSSGRGTSSEAGSAASQNGDDLLEATNINGNAKLGPLQQQLKEHQQPPTGEKGAPTSGKGHRRRSSLFKAGKILSSSQVSLHKLKSLFHSVGGGGGEAAGQTGKKANQQQQQQQATTQFDHLEASRLRCMELNQAISVTSIGGATGAPKQQQQPHQPVSLSPNGQDDDESKDAFETTLAASPEMKPEAAPPSERSLTGKAITLGHGGEVEIGQGGAVAAAADGAPMDKEARCSLDSDDPREIGTQEPGAVPSKFDPNPPDDRSTSGQQTNLEQPMAATLRVA